MPDRTNFHLRPLDTAWSRRPVLSVGNAGTADQIC